MEQSMTWQGGPDVPSTTWRGGANVPSMAFGRLNATWPFASLRLSHSGIVLTAVRHRFHLTPADMVAAFPCSASLLSKGIGLETRDGRVLVFWTSEASAILPALQAAGFPVSPAPRNAFREIRAARWRAAPTGSARGQFALRWVLLLAGLLCVVLLKPILLPDYPWTMLMIALLAFAVLNGLLYLRRK
ncbi:hypothetical protein [Actinomadura montaniterrae]|uniref:Uncharacterized protein n=1 Tax=Actinomadura montaniterrae TaxID=1803903 RepID=A0A6L3VGC6_9ACTN|nr:hypothetical protein [Actinomadura montaniterrae]KAB2366726.1 hypothetical protein F9B16_39395 [Actinomadura montaniterrae]